MLTGRAHAWLTAAVADLTYPDSWLSGRYTDFARWQVEARACFIEALGALPPPVPPEPSLIHQEERECYTATLLAFNVDSAFRTEAYLLMPHGDGPFPALLALHDHSAFYAWGKEKLVRSPAAAHPALAELVQHAYGGRFLADELARRGYAVLVIDQWLWGQQRVADVPGADTLDLQTVEGVRAYNRLMADFERQVAFAMLFAGRTMPGQMLHADRRGLDVLLQDPRVDPARIGCIGLSVGGFRAFHLAAADPRIVAAVEIGWMVSLADYLRNHDHLYRWPNAAGLCASALARHLDYPDAVGLACPRPFLLMAGRQDTLYPLAAVEKAFVKIHAIYASQGTPDHVDTRWYDVPHCFDVAMQEDAFVWLDRWLKAEGNR